MAVMEKSFVAVTVRLLVAVAVTFLFGCKKAQDTESGTSARHGQPAADSPMQEAEDEGEQPVEDEWTILERCRDRPENLLFSTKSLLIPQGQQFSQAVILNDTGVAVVRVFTHPGGTASFNYKVTRTRQNTTEEEVMAEGELYVLGNRTREAEHEFVVYANDTIKVEAAPVSTPGAFRMSLSLK